MGRTSLALAVAVAMVPGIAAADRPHLRDAAADRHLQAGLDHFEAKDYVRASKELQQAQLIEPTPFLLYSVAQAERLAGNCERAINLYREYLRIDDLPRQSSDLARGFVEQCEQSMPTPRSGPAVEERPSGAPRPWYTSLLGGALTISGVGALGVGIGYLSASSSSEERAGGAMFLDDHNAALSDAARERTIGAVALTLGLGLVGSGVYVYITHSRRHQPDAVVTTNGRAIIVAGRF